MSKRFSKNQNIELWRGLMQYTRCHHMLGFIFAVVVSAQVVLSTGTTSWGDWLHDHQTGGGFVELHKGDRVNAIFDSYCSRLVCSVDAVQTCVDGLWSYWRYIFGNQPDVFVSPSNTRIVTDTSFCQQCTMEINGLKYIATVDAFDDQSSLLRMAHSIACAINSDDGQRNQVVQAINAKLHEHVKLAQTCLNYQFCLNATFRRRSLEEFSQRDMSELSTITSAEELERFLPSSSYECVYPYQSTEQKTHPKVLLSQPLGSCIFHNLVFYDNEWIFLSTDSPDNPSPEPPPVRLDAMFHPFSSQDPHQQILSLQTVPRDEFAARVRRDRALMLSRGPVCSSLLYVNESLSRETESSMHDVVGQYVTRPHILLSRVVPVNHGHALLDGALPLYWTLRLHRSKGHLAPDQSIDLRDNTVVIVDGQPPGVTDDRLRLVSSRPPLYVPTDRRGRVAAMGRTPSAPEIKHSSLCPTGAVCRFGTVLAGIGGFGSQYLGEHHRHRRQLYDSLRASALAELTSPVESSPSFYHPECNPPVCNYSYILPLVEVESNESHTSPKEPFTLLIIQRVNFRSFTNLPKIIQVIHSRLPHAHVVIDEFEDKSLDYQVWAMQSVSAVLAVDGAAVDNSIFLPPCSGLAVVARDVTEWGSMHMKDGFDMHHTHFATWQQWLAIVLIPTSAGDGYVSDVDLLGDRLSEMVYLQEACAVSQGGEPRSLSSGIEDIAITRTDAVGGEATARDTSADSPMCSELIESVTPITVREETNGTLTFINGDSEQFTLSNQAFHSISRECVSLHQVLSKLEFSQKTVSIINPGNAAAGYTVFWSAFHQAHRVRVYSADVAPLETLIGAMNFLHARMHMRSSVEAEVVDTRTLKGVEVADLTILFGMDWGHGHCCRLCGPLTEHTEKMWKICLTEFISQTMEGIASRTLEHAVFSVTYPPAAASSMVRLFTSLLEDNILVFFETFRVVGRLGARQVIFEALSPLTQVATSSLSVSSSVRLSWVSLSKEAGEELSGWSNTRYPLVFVAAVSGVRSPLYDHVNSRYVNAREILQCVFFLDDLFVMSREASGRCPWRPESIDGKYVLELRAEVRGKGRHNATLQLIYPRRVGKEVENEVLGVIFEEFTLQ